jgi:hypothetical protein
LFNDVGDEVCGGDTDKLFEITTASFDVDDIIAEGCGCGRLLLFIPLLPLPPNNIDDDADDGSALALSFDIRSRDYLDNQMTPLLLSGMMIDERQVRTGEPNIEVIIDA